MMMKNTLQKIALFIFGGVISTSLFMIILQHSIEQSKDQEFHEHADFAVFLNGEKFDFSQEKYMNYEPCKISSNSIIQKTYAHSNNHDDIQKSNVDLHGNNGNVIHVHKQGITYQDFFHSLQIDFDDQSFTEDEGNTYKNNNENIFQFFINNQQVDSLYNQEIRNLDKVLISYGQKNRSKSSLFLELAQISNSACIESGSCTHRERAEPESCGTHTKPFLLELFGI
jgi:competence protein ComGF